MFQNLEVFQMSHAMAKHAGQRQAVIAQNVANADTPGYAEQDIASFRDTYGGNHDAAVQRATRSTHLNGLQSGAALPTFDVRSPASPNENSVSVETEMLKATEVDRQHSRALAIYKSSLGILRSTLGRGA